MAKHATTLTTHNMIRIPSPNEKKWSQTNSGDVFGNLYSTRNVDLDQEGYLTLAQKARAYFRTAGSGASFDQVLAIVFSAVGNLVFTSDSIYEMDLDDTDSAPLTVNADSGVQSPTTNGDGIAWNARIYNTGATATKYWDGSNWTSASIVLVSGVPHPMCVFESLNYLAVATDKNIVKTYDTSHTLKQTLTIPAEYEIQWMVYRDSNLYIGTRSIVGAEGKMFVWNGSGTAAQKSYGVRGEVSMSGCEYQNSIATVNSLGQVLLFNGGGFSELAAFPVYYTRYKWTDAGQRMARRGMIASGQLLYINIEGFVKYNTSTIILPNQPSGLWVFDPKYGLYHRGGFSADYPTYASVTGVNITTNVITLGTAVETQTGEPVVYTQSTSPIGGIVNRRVYYAIRVTSTTFKFAETYDDAIAGTAVDLTSDPGAYNGTLLCPKGGDFGETHYLSLVAGAVAVIPESEQPYDFLTTKILYGGWRATEDIVGTDYSTLMSFVPGENRGNFVTQKIFSSNIEDVWNKAVVKVRNVYNANDKVLVKYRTSEKQYYPITPFTFQNEATVATWTDTDTFTITNSKWANVVAGEEVEIVAGAGSGFTAHISSISSSSGTYTVNLDEAVPLISASDTSYVIVDNWTKGATLTSSDTVLHKTTSINDKSKWIQLKVELRGDGTQVEELQSINKPHLPSV
jgi:hypothetical protein